MIVSIGGSSSTGSSLLVQLLNRHQKIITGPESSLLARPQLYYDWQKHKNKITEPKFSFLRNYSWHRDNLVEIPYSTLNIKRYEVERLIEDTRSFKRFLLLLENLVLSRNSSEVWVEKTPANTVLFSPLLNAIDNCKCILTIRDPYEAIASMTYRGHDPVYSCCIYLMNTSFGLLGLGHSAWKSIKYEDLVTDYHKVCNDLADFLKLKNEYDWTIDIPTIKMKGWKYAETDLPNGKINLRYATLPKKVQDIINYCVHNLQIKKDFDIYGIRAPFKCIRDISEEMGYILNPIGGDCFNAVNKKLIKEKIIRTIKLHPTHYLNFPIEINR